ncbi:MAG: ferrous iron transporter B [Pirellulales bacterium]|nr:ferrous iron transporter B [Pirellulales bacterium]
MASSDPHPPFSIALVGNPNTGKSTVFTALVGGHQRVGNYPGVTVEQKIGRAMIDGRACLVVDLPGVYSLAPRSRDEMITVDLLLGRRAGATLVDAVLCVVDASNLERNLYLVSQLLELGLPTVVALNMVDVARGQGIQIDVEALRQRLPVPVVEIQANRRLGIDALRRALARLGPEGALGRGEIFPETFRRAVAELAPRLEGRGCCRRARCRGRVCSQWMAQRLLLDVGGYLEGHLAPGADNPLRGELADIRARLVAGGCPVPNVETQARYAWAKQILEGIVTMPGRREPTTSDRLDRVLTHRLWGTTILAVVMFLVFQAVFVWAVPAMELIEKGFSALGGAVSAGLAGTSLAGGAIESLLVDGVIGGTGSVFQFLPQILILFFFIALLEDCGYLARAAYLMDRLMARVGLSGTAFIPLLSSFACAVPAIMATRVIANERDRLTTILVAPLLTCSARLPIYALLIAAFIPPEARVAGVGVQGLTLVGLYLLGIVMAVLAAFVLKRTVLRGASAPFFMELPAYHWPTPRVVAFRVFERGWVFIRAAGTIILLVSIAIWAALYFPHNAEVVEAPFAPRRAALADALAAVAPGDPAQASLEQGMAELNAEIQSAYQRQSILGRMGRAIEPVVRPLGWDWRIGCAVLASFPAREAVVASLGVTFHLGPDVEDPLPLGERLRAATWEGADRPLFTLPVALSVLVFFALCIQCAATLAVIARETRGWRWPAFTLAYMTALAYLGALITYQVGTWWMG